MAIKRMTQQEVAQETAAPMNGGGGGGGGAGSDLMIANVKPSNRGLERAKLEFIPRLIASVCGHEKSGKTEFAIATAPEPVAVLAFDPRTREAILRHQRKKEIWHRYYALPPVAGRTPQEVMSDYQGIWQEYLANYLYSLPKFATVITDTASEAWDVLRLASAGKLNPKYGFGERTAYYGMLNAAFLQVLRAPNDHDCNAIFTHRVKREYLDDKATGKYERAGFKDVEFEMQVNLQTYCDPGKPEGEQFWTQIINCGPNGGLGGAVMVGEENTFERLLMAAWEGSL